MRTARQMIDMQNHPMKSRDGGVFVRFNTCSFTRSTILKTSQQITRNSWGGEKIFKVRKNRKQMFPTAQGSIINPKEQDGTASFPI